MDSSASLSGRAMIVRRQCDDDDNIFQAKNSSPSRRRRPSFSSSSSSSCSSSLRSLNSFPGESPLSPATPLGYSGVPFSWESLPGIPKKHNSHKKQDALFLKQLPLPPTSTRPTSCTKSSHRYHSEECGTRAVKKNHSPFQGFERDPFVAALVECSKDDGDEADEDQDSSPRNSNFFNGAKVITRSIGDRFGLVNLHSSCKKTCAVSESLVYLPRSTRTSSPSYDLIHHHHHRRRAR